MAAFPRLCPCCLCIFSTQRGTRCAQGPAYGLDHLDAPRPAVTASSRRNWRREEDVPRGSSLGHSDSSSQAQRPGPTKAPWPALAFAHLLPGRGHPLPRGHSPRSFPSNLPSALGNKFHHSFIRAVGAQGTQMHFIGDLSQGLSLLVRHCRGKQEKL